MKAIRKKKILRRKRKKNILLRNRKEYIIEVYNYIDNGERK